MGDRDAGCVNNGGVHDNVVNNGGVHDDVVNNGGVHDECGEQSRGCCSLPFSCFLG